ncbi:hypothetical protein J7F03_36730 [Streptomyces sp. ISL-43]|uniref:hypothetical protein n=1 Tax=Streptomyces sp. ISL-43 TaxID=2819183 RepID=UPI001BE573DE|nr:hypothetical protein [Streptomyces sp. ISL-43]MBT2452505.1 hypothetical protein [Streptomyces sp. ISL-43]
MPGPVVGAGGDALWPQASRRFDGCLGAWASGVERQRPFDADGEYRELVDGKPRYDGALAFLTARGIDLPTGVPDDDPGCDTVGAVAARKEQIFSGMLGTLPAGAAVVEDAIAGVEAGRRGHFGLVIGIDRSRHADTAGAMRARGANVVLPDLAGLPTTLSGHRP